MLFGFGQAGLEKMFENNCHTCVCSIRARTDNPLGFKCLYKHKPLVILIICCMSDYRTIFRSCYRSYDNVILMVVTTAISTNTQQLLGEDTYVCMR